MKTISNIAAGGTPDRGTPKYRNGNIPWLKISDVTLSNKYVKKASEYITKDGLNNSSAKILKKGTILYTIFATIGEVRILDFDASCNQAIAGLNLYENEINDFLYLSLINLQDYMKSLSKGCAQFNINQNILKNTIIALPPLSEQQRIVNKINSLEPLLQKYEEIEKELSKLESEFPEKLKKSILQYAIQGKLVKQNPNDEPASVLLEHIKEEKEKLIKEGKIKRDKNESYIFQGDDKNYYEKIGNNKPIRLENLPFEIPESWEWIRIKEMFEIRNGFTPLKTNISFWKNGTIPWFSIEDIHNQGRIINSTIQKINEIACTKNRIVPKNSLLLCCTASIGEYALTKIPLTTNQQFNASTCKNSYIRIFNMNFLFSIADYFKNILLNLSGTTTFPFVSTKKLGDIPIPLPPLKEQEKIVNKIDHLFFQINN